MKTLREYIEILDEISRRDFLKGAGAALGSVVLGAPKGAFGQETPGSYGPAQVDVGKLVVDQQPDANAYYPSFSKRAGEQGTVVVRMNIDDSGTVENVQLLQSSKFVNLDRAAGEIAKRYHFKPYLINGVPSRVSTNVLIKFTLPETGKTNEEELDENSEDAVARILELSKK
jgi:TonB family protein